MLTRMDYLLLATVVYAAWSDVRTGTVPNWLTYGGAIVFILAHLAASEPRWVGLSGAATGFSLWMLLYVAAGVGGGDVKLMTAVGAAMGIGGLLIVSLYAICLAFLMALVWVIASGLSRHYGRRLARGAWISLASRSMKDQIYVESRATLPFAAAICLAVCAALLERVLGTSLLYSI